jgi:hypothetical protein
MEGGWGFTPSCQLGDSAWITANRKLTRYRGPVSGYAPDVLGFIVAKQVTVAVVQEHAKVSRARRIPAIVSRHDFPGSVDEMQP